MAEVAPVRHLGVYDADGGIVGELRYVIGHLLGTAECALCDITHSAVRRRPAWDRMVAGLAVPFDLRHRNELTAAEAEAIAPMGLPVVATELADGRFVRTIGADGLAACGGDVEALRARLAAATAWIPPSRRPSPAATRDEPVRWTPHRTGPPEVP